MNYLEFEEKARIRTAIEKYCYLNRYEKNVKWREDSLDFDRINKLLKGSLDIEKIKRVENYILENQYFYISSSTEKRARVFCIGKAIIMLHDDQNSIIKFIPLDDFEMGIAEYFCFVKDKDSSYNKKKKVDKERLEFLENEFRNLGKGNEIEKGKILEEIDNILLENKEIITKEKMWEKLGINSDLKSYFCKRYKLFKEFETAEFFSGEENYRNAIEQMPLPILKNITKKGTTDEKKESAILEEIIKIKG